MKRSKFGYALLLVIVAALAYNASLDKDSLTTIEVCPFALGPLSGVVLWFWMISNYFANYKRIKHYECWGWFLFLANGLAAVVYFFAIYVPAEKKTRSHVS